MEVTNSSFNHVNKKEKSKSRNIGASLLAAGAAQVVPAISTPATMGIVSEMKKIGDIPADKINLLHEKADEAIKLAGLDKFGVKIQHLAKPKQQSTLISLLIDPISMVQNGTNAAFLPSKYRGYAANTILMPEKNISFAAFHEIGHAMNRNLSKIGRALQYMRTPGMYAAAALALFGAFTKESKPQDGQELSKAQKVKNFVRDNAGKLSFAAMLPMLVEEGMATFKGEKLAKKLLSPDMMKNVTKGNRVAYLSYLVAAAGLCLGSMAAVKIKDYFVDKKENK